jgi:hypothetical protein
MNGEMYLRYLKLFPTKRPGLVFWGNLCVWIAALGVNLYAVSANEPSLLGWIVSFFVIVWCIAGIGHWSKLLWSKHQIDKLLKV